jgi:RNA polymerase sigma-70 factor (ECF subfamily)
VHARQPRHRVDKARHTEVTTRFLEAAWSGDLDGVISMLAPDVVLVTDGGGKRRAALRPMHGPDKIARWVLAIATDDEQAAGFDIRITTLNGELAFVAYDGEVVDSVGFVEINAAGLIDHLYVVRNPDKLTTIPPKDQL